MRKIKFFLFSFLLVIIFCYCYYTYFTSLDYFINYLNKNPSRYSLSINVNGKNTVSHNADQPFILASSFKIINALEFSNQVTQGIIDTNRKVSIEDLNKLYIPFTDGGAHNKWTNDLVEKYGESVDSVKIIDVVNGMIHFSSNANTDYVSSVLTLDSINNRIKILNFKNHDKINYIVPLIILSNKEFFETKDSIFETNLSKARLKLINKEVVIDDIEISDSVKRFFGLKMPKSTTREYISIMHYLNYDTSSTNQIFKSIMEWPMKYDENKKYFYYLGGKGGDIKDVMTYNAYAFNKENDKIELSIFVNTDNLNFINRTLINKGMNKFIMDILKSKNTRNNCINKLVLN